MYLNIHIINAQGLTQRRDKITGVAGVIAECARGVGFTKVTPMFVDACNPKDITSTLAEFQKRVNYDTIGDADFDRLRQVLSVEMISNIEKHRAVWDIISSSAPNTINLVLEDDSVILNNGVTGLKDVLKYVACQDNASQWDMLFLGVAQPATPEDAKGPIVLTQVPKVIPCKEAYFVSVATASKLYKQWTDGALTNTLRVQMSHYLHNNKGIKAMVPNRRVTLDGSKLGLFPSTIHGSNMLLFNSEYMQIYKVFVQPEQEIVKQLHAVDKIMGTVKHMRNPDISHLYGMLLAKINKLPQAEEALLQAVDDTRSQQGLLNNRSEVCNNLVNLYQRMQHDVSIMHEKPSKYADMELTD